MQSLSSGLSSLLHGQPQQNTCDEKASNEKDLSREELLAMCQTLKTENKQLNAAKEDALSQNGILKKKAVDLIQMVRKLKTTKKKNKKCLEAMLTRYTDIPDKLTFEAKVKLLEETFLERIQRSAEQHAAEHERVTARHETLSAAMKQITSKLEEKTNDITRRESKIKTLQATVETQTHEIGTYIQKVEELEMRNKTVSESLAAAVMENPVAKIPVVEQGKTAIPPNNQDDNDPSTTQHIQLEELVSQRDALSKQVVDLTSELSQVRAEWTEESTQLDLLTEQIEQMKKKQSEHTDQQVSELLDKIKSLQSSQTKFQSMVSTLHSKVKTQGKEVKEAKKNVRQSQVIVNAQNAGIERSTKRISQFHTENNLGTTAELSSPASDPMKHLNQLVRDVLASWGAAMVERDQTKQLADDRGVHIDQLTKQLSFSEEAQNVFNTKSVELAQSQATLMDAKERLSVTHQQLEGVALELKQTEQRLMSLTRANEDQTSMLDRSAAQLELLHSEMRHSWLCIPESQYLSPSPSSSSSSTSSSSLSPSSSSSSESKDPPTPVTVSKDLPFTCMWRPVMSSECSIHTRLLLDDQVWVLLVVAAHGLDSHTDASPRKASVFWTLESTYVDRLEQIHGKLSGSEASATPELPVTLQEQLSEHVRAEAESTWRVKVGGLNSTITRLTTRIEELQTALDKKSHEHERYKARALAALENKTQQLRSVNYQTSSSVQLIAENHTLRGQLDLLQSELATMRTDREQMDHLRFELKQLTDRCGSLMRDRETAQVAHAARVQLMGATIKDNSIKHAAALEELQEQLQCRAMQLSHTQTETEREEGGPTQGLLDQQADTIAALSAKIELLQAKKANDPVSCPARTPSSPMSNTATTATIIQALPGTDQSLRVMLSSPAKRFGAPNNPTDSNDVKDSGSSVFPSLSQTHRAEDTHRLRNHVRRLQKLLQKAETDSLQWRQRVKALGEQVQSLSLKSSREEELLEKGKLNYLKNIVVRYVETDDHDGIFPALCTVLQLSTEEIERIKQRRARPKGYFNFW